MALVTAVVTEYPHLIAIEDFAPVVLTVVGGIALSRFVAKRDAGLGRLARLGTIVLTAGGLAKAVWKLIRSFDGPDEKWLAGLLFPLLATGFACLAWALVHHDYRETGAEAPRPGEAVRRLPLRVAAGTGVLAFVLSATTRWSRIWVAPLIALTTVASLAVVIVCVKSARRRLRPVAAALFIVNFVGALVLTRLSRADQTVGLQWFEQAVNTAAAGAFALGARTLAASSPVGVDRAIVYST